MKEVVSIFQRIIRIKQFEFFILIKHIKEICRKVYQGIVGSSAKP